MMKKWMLIVSGWLLASSCLAVELTLPSVFADHMVLQRGQGVPVWGTADPGAEIIVEFAEQKKKVTVGEDAAWRVDLDPLEASSESRVLTLTATLKGEEQTRTISDVLVGEVWFCGGQSNMDWTLKSLSQTARNPKYQPIVEYIRKETASANDPLFRHFKMARTVNLFELETQTGGEWTLAIEGQANTFSGTGYFFGRELRRELDVPVALLSCNWGGTRVEPWIPMSTYTNAALNAYYEEQKSATLQRIADWDEEAVKKAFADKLSEWEKRAAEAEAAGEKAPRKPRMEVHPTQNHQFPGALFNGMVHALVPYAVKGAIWYQGESNRAHMPEEYADRFPTMIKSWREQWGQERLFFYWCQLAAYTEPNLDPLEEDNWAVVCDAQRRTLHLKDTGMAVLNDIGEAEDIHPRNKVDAGKRLSLWALQQAYGRKNVCSGPLYRKAEFKGGKVIVTFDHTGSGLMVGKKTLLKPAVQVYVPLRRFQICGADREWKWAQARILNNTSVEVWHSEISEPVEVRYAWSANPEGANLYNKEGLPTSVFTTGD